MPKTSSSKQTGGVTWLMQRVSGLVLILLLLAHFWVQHFFINDFYGKMNIIDMSPKAESLAQKLNEMNPLWGKHYKTFIAPVHADWKGQDHFLTKKSIDGPTTVTIVEQRDRTEILKGRIESRTELKQILGSLAEDAKISHKTINPKQIKTKLMINHSDVQARVSNIWWKTYNMLFLVLAIYHGLAGTWDVLLDYKMSPMLRMSLYGTVITIGLILFIVGSLIIIPMGL